IEDQDLGVTAHGRVTRVSRTPGTNGVDPSRFYLAVVPTSNLPSLVGASVKLTIAVKSTNGAVLAVPVSALSIGGHGRARSPVPPRAPHHRRPRPVARPGPARGPHRPRARRPGPRGRGPRRGAPDARRPAARRP